jgi:nitroreductase/NAD-dependent dihydropyrimidine dehydrogenase PreA subunit
MPIKTGFGDTPAVPHINQETCRACGLCVRVCTGDVVRPGDGGVSLHPDSAIGCVGCAQCMLVCPTGSVTVTGRDVSPADLLPLPPPGTSATPEQLEALLLSRRSVRSFTSQEVSPETIDRVLNLASTAPMGLPPSDVGVVVFRGRERVQALAEDVTRTMERWLRYVRPWMLPLARPFIGKTLYESVTSFVLPIMKLLVDKRNSGTDWLLYDAPAALLFHLSPYADPADSAIAATYAMVAAQSLGLGSCMIGTVGYVVGYSRRLKAKYGIPQTNRPGLVLLLGYPALSYHRTIRRRFASVSYV